MVSCYLHCFGTKFVKKKNEVKYEDYSTNYFRILLNRCFCWKSIKRTLRGEMYR